MWSKNELNPQIPTIHRLLVITQIASLRKSKCSSFDSCNKEKNMARIYKICIFGLEFFWTMKFVSSKIKSTFNFPFLKTYLLKGIKKSRNSLKLNMLLKIVKPYTNNKKVIAIFSALYFLRVIWRIWSFNYLVCLPTTAILYLRWICPFTTSSIRNHLRT